MSGYFLYHSIGTYENKAFEMQQALGEYASIWSAHNDDQWAYALAQVDEFKGCWAQLLKVKPENITFSENVTSGLYSIIGALGTNRLQGKTVLVSADCFPSLHFLLQKLAERFGFNLRTVPLSAGLSYVTEEDFIAAWDDEVELALITWVSSTTSYRVDLESLLAASRRYNSLVVIDITQGAGVIPFEITPDMDFVLSASLKWVCGATAASALYVSPTVLAQCEPEYRGWFSQDNPFNWDITQFNYAPDARRFEHGTPSVLGSIASLPGIRYVLKHGVDFFFKNNRNLTNLIIDWAHAENYEILTPKESEKRGGSVMVRLASIEVAAQAVAELKQRDIFIDARSDIVRISPGVVSSESKLLQLCGFLESLRK